jgi:hypothetical protein
MRSLAVATVIGTMVSSAHAAQVLNLENLEALYRAPVKRLTDPATGEQAFLPG